jgi:hypothetical protein
MPTDTEKLKPGPTLLNKIQLAERKAEFEKRLHSFAKSRYIDFQKQNGETILDVDKNKAWNTCFNLESEPLPLAPLPAKPVIKNQISMKNIIDVGNEKLLELFYRAKQTCEKGSMSDNEDNRLLAGNRLIEIVS